MLPGYSIAEVAERSGLKPRSVQDLVYRSDLIRGQDFFVSRRTLRLSIGIRLRRNIRFTDRGLARVVARDYRTFKQRAKVRSQESVNGLADGRPDWKSIAGIPSGTEKRMILKGFLQRFALDYPASGGCALPSCRCICHALGVPLADLIAELLTKHR